MSYSEQIISNLFSFSTHKKPRSLEAPVKESGLLEDNVVDQFESIVDKMSDDELLILDIQEKCSHCTEEDIEEEFYSRKKSKSISKYMKGLRERYKEQEEYKIQELQKQSYIRFISKLVLQHLILRYILVV